MNQDVVIKYITDQDATSEIAERERVKTIQS